jgi:hypothetical protein
MDELSCRRPCATATAWVGTDAAITVAQVIVRSRLAAMRLFAIGVHYGYINTRDENPKRQG